MIDYDEQRQKYYRQRVGKVYGVWRVVSVRHDDTYKSGQEWVMQCIKCGKTKVVHNGLDYVKGRVGARCSCMNKKRVYVPKPSFESKVEKVYGQVQSSWKAIKFERGKGLLCECQKCGRVSYLSVKSFVSGKTKKCLCEFNKKKYDDVAFLGKRYGHLVVVGFEYEKRVLFKCVCDCGKVIAYRPIYLINGAKVCCGDDCIYKNEKSKLTEGNSKEILYKKWRGMKARCDDLANPTYGGRGIKVCDEWKNDYVAFRKWALANGYADNLSIDRIDPDGDYKPDNCRFIPLADNSSRARHTTYTIKSGYRERRKSKYSDVQVVIDGYACDLPTACRLTGFIMPTILARVNNGMTWQEAFDTPKKIGRPKKR